MTPTPFDQSDVQKTTKKSQIETLFQQGLSYSEIARRVGTRYQHVHNVLGNKNKRTQERPVEYEAAEAFFDRCFARTDSYLWPNRSVWSIQTIQAYIDAINASTDEEGSFYDRLQQQLAGQPGDVYRFAADLLLFYYLFPDWVRRETKIQNVRRAAAWGVPEDPPDPTILNQSFAKGLGGVGTHYFSAQAYELLYFAHFALEAKTQNVDLEDSVATETLADAVLAAQRDCTEARHLLLHFLFPDRFEPIVSNRHKRLITTAFHDYAAGEEGVDAKIHKIRAELTPKFGENFSFYDPKVKPLWETSAASRADEPPGTGPDSEPDNPLRSQSYTLADLQRDTFWPDDRIGEVLEALEGPLPVVLAGPPGTGKTWFAKCLIRFLTGDDSRRHRLVQFHPGFAYEQFMEGLQPVLENGAMTFRAVPGIVVDMARSLMGTEPNHYLIIDEMNRANLPRVLGELMYLLEYRDESVTLPYTGSFQLPHNLRFIGTMNTADRSIRSIDVALRRRFELFDCLPDPSILAHYYTIHRNEVPDLVQGFTALNNWLTEELDSHHTIGHTFFMHDVLNEKRLKQVWKRQLRPLLEEYFFDQPEKLASAVPSTFWTSIAP